MLDSFTFKTRGKSISNEWILLETFFIFGGSIHYNPEYSMQTLKSNNPDHYQRVCKFSKDGKIFAAGTSDGQVLVLKILTDIAAFFLVIS